MTKRKTGFDKYFEAQMKEPAFAKAYAAARAQIDSVDHLVRFLDATRLAADMPKAELARRINAKPEVIRRLFTATPANPTMTTVLKIADALGLELQLVPKPARAHRRAGPRATQRRTA